MTTGIIIAAIVILLVLVAAAGFFVLRSGGRPGSLRRRFGPEYERTVERHGGDTAAARQDLQERQRRYGEIKMRPLTGQERERYAAEWTGVQERFVDSPAQAVTEADTLLVRLVHDRGFPDPRTGEQIDALSVHRPRHVQAYREVRAAAGRARDDDSSTEELREVLVHARELFDDLVEPGPKDQGPGSHDGKHRAHRLHLLSRSS